MPILTLATYVQRNTSEAGAPGVSARTVQLTHVRKEHVAPNEVGPNDALFEGPHGNAGVNLNSITADVAKLFPSGAKVKVTFELIKE
jgi:hypothetical protein